MLQCVPNSNTRRESPADMLAITPSNDNSDTKRSPSPRRARPQLSSYVVSPNDKTVSSPTTWPPQTMSSNASAIMMVGAPSTVHLLNMATYQCANQQLKSAVVMSDHKRIHMMREFERFIIGAMQLKPRVVLNPTTNMTTAAGATSTITATIPARKHSGKRLVTSSLPLLGTTRSNLNGLEHVVDAGSAIERQRTSQLLDRLGLEIVYDPPSTSNGLFESVAVAIFGVPAHAKDLHMGIASCRAHIVSYLYQLIELHVMRDKARQERRARLEAEHDYMQRMLGNLMPDTDSTRTMTPTGIISNSDDNESHMSDNNASLHSSSYEFDSSMSPPTMSDINDDDDNDDDDESGDSDHESGLSMEDATDAYWFERTSTPPTLHPLKKVTPRVERYTHHERALHGLHSGDMAQLLYKYKKPVWLDSIPRKLDDVGRTFMPRSWYPGIKPCVICRHESGLVSSGRYCNTTRSIFDDQEMTPGLESSRIHITDEDYYSENDEDDDDGEHELDVVELGHALMAQHPEAAALDFALDSSESIQDWLTHPQGYCASSCDATEDGDLVVLAKCFGMVVVIVDLDDHDTFMNNTSTCALGTTSHTIPTIPATCAAVKQAQYTAIGHGNALSTMNVAWSEDASLCDDARFMLLHPFPSELSATAMSDINRSGGNQEYNIVTHRPTIIIGRLQRGRRYVVLNLKPTATTGVVSRLDEMNMMDRIVRQHILNIVTQQYDTVTLANANLLLRSVYGNEAHVECASPRRQRQMHQAVSSPSLSSASMQAVLNERLCPLPPGLDCSGVGVGGGTPQLPDQWLLPRVSLASEASPPKMTPYAMQEMQILGDAALTTWLSFRKMQLSNLLQMP